MSQQGPKETDRDLADQLSREDTDAMDEFCAGIDLDEIEYDQWCDHHRCLDLVFTLSIDPSRAASGCIELIEMSRSLIKSENGEKVLRREKFQVKVEIPSGTKCGHLMRLRNYGDFSEGHKGDLLVTIRIAKRK